MQKFVKALALLTIFSIFFTASHAQLKLPVVNSGIASDVKKVIEDFPNRFINLMGEMLAENTQSTDYACNFKVNGAEACFITRYSAKKEICSWEALMLTTESFDKAKQKFKNLYSQLNNLTVNYNGVKNFHLKGLYESPMEERKFTSVLFDLEPNNEKAKKLKVEITMQYIEPMEWAVKVLVYDREREDDERGKIIEE